MKDDTRIKTIWLMRHGSLPVKYDGCLVGSTDAPLSEQGRTEAAAAAAFLSASPPFDLIFASPARRVRQTMETALPAGELARVNVIPELRETDFGLWEGLSIADIGKRFPSEMSAWAANSPGFAFPGGESMTEFERRVEMVKSLLIRAESSRILIFSHGGMILALICSFLGLPREKMIAFKLARGAFCRLDIYPPGNSGALSEFNLKPWEYRLWQQSL